MSFPILGLTGPSGAGKGELARRLRDAHGFAWIDTDKVYHTLTSTPSPCLDELRTAFGEGVIKNGALDRPALAAIVFAPDAQDQLLLLNSITHKHVLKESALQIDLARQNGARGAILDAPLLYEAGADALCTHTAAVLADAEVRLDRIMARDNLSKQAAQRRLQAQKPDAFYTHKVDFTIYNNGTADALCAQADALAKELL